MDDGTHLPPKLYFRIGEVAGLVGVEPHVLRYWEREFRSIRPSKSAKGQRVYSRRDVENLMRVRELLYTQGFTIAGAKKRLQRSGVEPDDKPTTNPANDVRGATADTQTAGPSPTPPPAPCAPSTSPVVLEHLAALRAEVTAFLDELGG